MCFHIKNASLTRKKSTAISEILWKLSLFLIHVLNLIGTLSTDLKKIECLSSASSKHLLAGEQTTTTYLQLTGGACNLEHFKTTFGLLHCFSVSDDVFSSFKLYEFNFLSVGQLIFWAIWWDCDKLYFLCYATSHWKGRSSSEWWRTLYLQCMAHHLAEEVFGSKYKVTDTSNQRFWYLKGILSWKKSLVMLSKVIWYYIWS